MLVSEKEVRRQARVEWLEMKRHLPLEPDARVQTYVQCVANRLIAQLDEEHKKLDWEVVVFDDESVNASANPDGKIAVLNGLLKVADTPDSLAAVLGHEIAHATLNHVMDRAKKGARTDMLVLFGAAALGWPRRRTERGRDDRSRAALRSRAGIRGGPGRFDVHVEGGLRPARGDVPLEEHVRGRTRISPPEFLSSHPSDDARLDAIVKAITPALVEYNKAREAGKRPNCQIR